ncbi:MAG: integrase [Candidatus Aenigmatarchaeota archaeon]
MTTIRIDQKILQEAQELGINISKFTENALKIAIQKIKEANNQIAGMGARLIIDDGNRTVSIPSLGVQMGDLEVEGSNPSPGILQVDWKAFAQWLARDKSPSVVRDVLSYAKRYEHCLKNMDLSEIATLSVSKRRLVLASLSNLAKFLGVYDQWKQTVHRYGVKWTSMETKDKRIIDRITRKTDPETVYGAVRTAKQLHPEYADFLDFCAVTGMRLVEAIESWNLIRSITSLSDYYDVEKEVLMHYKFPEKFLRKGKKTFISFVPKELVNRIRSKHQIQIASRHTVGKTLNVHFGDLREAHASIMTKYLSQAEIDFLQGRVGTSVFMQNYFNPALISDLKERVFKGIMEIQNKIS